MITDIRKAKTLDKALKMAGLSWDVESIPLVAKVGNKSHEVPGYKVITRADTGQVLSIVGERFEALGQSKLFKIVDDIMKRSNAEFRLAGSLDGGRRVFVQIAFGSATLDPKDTVERRLTFFDTHDSSSAPFALATPTRLASEGFNNVSIPTFENRVTLRRTDVTDIDQGIAVMDMALTFFKQFEAHAAILQHREFTAADMMFLVKQLLPAEDESKVPTRTVNNRLQLIELFGGGAKHEENGIVGTRWGALQAVVEYVDRHRGTRVKDGDDAATRRLESGFFGSGLQLKQQAFDLLTGFANGKVAG